MHLKFDLITAVNNKNVIGDQTNLGYIIPWNCPEDLKMFNRITSHTESPSKKNVIIMGFNTFKSIGCGLPGRINLVMSSKEDYCIHSLDELIKECQRLQDSGSVNKFFIIGGSLIYKMALDNLFINTIYYSLIDNNSDGSVTFPVTFNDLMLKYNVKSQDKTINAVYFKLKRKFKPFEYQYNKLLSNINSSGSIKLVRNGSTKSTNDVQIKVDLSDGFPILTVKRTFWRGIVEELMWMLRGQTDTKILSDKGIKIWDKNSTREFLDNRGLTDYPIGEIGPGYGYQFRKIPGHDQLQEIIKLICDDPNSRRIIINLWNVSDLDLMALPPCHLLYQFNVTDNRLSCHLYQRSWDMLLGWNTSTAALLTHLLAHHLKMDVGTLTHTISDIHIYENHLHSVKEILGRIPFKLPKLNILTHHDEITDYQFSDFELSDYKYHPSIQLEMNT